MTTQKLSEEIFKRYGAVTRARGYFLYTKKGVRLTDLYLEDGRAVLGWHYGTAFTQMKNYLSRGITGSFRTEEVSRLEKAASELLGKKRRVFCFADKKSALEAALIFSKDKTCVWKPFYSETDYADFDAIVFCPPLPWTNTFFLLAVESSLVTEDAELLIKSKIKLPFPLEAAVTRSIYDYLKEVPLRKETDWFLYDTYLKPYFTRTGCHLTPKIPEEKYDEFVLYCLDHKIVINPHYLGESFVPYQVDKGNFTEIKNSPFAF